jgi:hypothetical protein
LVRDKKWFVGALIIADSLLPIRSVTGKREKTAANE